MAQFLCFPLPLGFRGGYPHYVALHAIKCTLCQAVERRFSIFLLHYQRSVKLVPSSQWLPYNIYRSKRVHKKRRKYLLQKPKKYLSVFDDILIRLCNSSMKVSSLFPFNKLKKSIYYKCNTGRELTAQLFLSTSSSVCLFVFIKTLEFGENQPYLLYFPWLLTNSKETQKLNLNTTLYLSAKILKLNFP